MIVRIEWLVEELDMTGVDDPEEADILDPHHFDTYAEAVAFAEDCDNLCRIGLVRDRGNDAEGVIDRQWAYLMPDPALPTYATQMILPERFADSGGAEGAKVPARYHNELRRAK